MSGKQNDVEKAWCSNMPNIPGFTESVKLVTLSNGATPKSSLRGNLLGTVRSRPCPRHPPPLKQESRGSLNHRNKHRGQGQLQLLINSEVMDSVGGGGGQRPFIRPLFIT